MRTALGAWKAAFVGPLIFLKTVLLDTLAVGPQQDQSRHFTEYSAPLAASTLFVAAPQYLTAGATHSSSSGTTNLSHIPVPTLARTYGRHAT
jgi:hypothetical protein